MNGHKILYRYTWRWGDTSNIIFDLNVPGSRTDLARVIAKLKDKTESKDIVHYEFHLIAKSISSDEIMSMINSYPTHDAS